MIVIGCIGVSYSSSCTWINDGSIANGASVQNSFLGIFDTPSFTGFLRLCEAVMSSGQYLGLDGDNAPGGIGQVF